MTTNKKTNKDINTTEIIAMGGLFTALTAPFSVPIAMATGAITALGAVTTHLTKSNKDTEGKYYLTKWDQLFLSNGIYAKDMGEGIRLPKLQRVTEIPLGKMYVFKLPMGIESSDIRRIATSIKEAYGSLKIEIELLEPQLVAIIQQFEEDENERLFEGTVSNDDWNTLWRAIKVTTKDEFTGELIYPILVNECEEDEVKTFTFKLPIGRSSAAFARDEKETTVREFLNARQIEIKPLTENKIEIKAIYKELPRDIPFEIIPRTDQSAYELYIGKTLNGYVRLDFRNMANVLDAGMQGSGKSVATKCGLLGAVCNYSPEELEIYISDLKRTELNRFRNVKHVKRYVETPLDTNEMIKDLLEIMDERYKLFAKYGVSDAYEYNERFPNDKLPYIFVVIEEMARFTSNKSLKDHCTKAKENDQNEKLAELLFAGRAAAMTLWVTVQRPTKDNLSPDVKSSLGNILAFQTTNSINSRIICDSDDKLKYLRGRGHGYFINEGCEEEFQGFFISNEEIEKILKERNLYK